MKINHLGSRVILILLVGILGYNTYAQGVEMSAKELDYQIRREKFDLVMPKAMKDNGVDMLIHIMRIAIPDEIGENEFGSNSGVFVFTDQGNGRVERAALGRRWGETLRDWMEGSGNVVEECGAYDIINKPIFVQEPLASPMIEYDFRFNGLREFVEARDPKTIAINFIFDLGQWETYIDFGGAKDGISHTDYLLLVRELGEKYAERLISSEYVIRDYITTKVPTEIKYLQKISNDRVAKVKKAMQEIEPGISKFAYDLYGRFRRESTGISQRGRDDNWKTDVVKRGDIISAPSVGLYGYVLKEGEIKAPAEIQKIWKEYLKIDHILATTIKAGFTPREIFNQLEEKFAAADIIVRADQLHMFNPPNNFSLYTEGYDKTKTHLSIDCHGMLKGSRETPEENYIGPRISSYGPTWTWDVPLKDPHHFVLEYFFYIPSPTDNPEEDQYLFFWDHEQTLAYKDGVRYLSTPQKELILIK